MRLSQSDTWVCLCSLCECEDLPMKLFGRRSERNRFIFILVLLTRWTAKFVVVVVVVVALVHLLLLVFFVSFYFFALLPHSFSLFIQQTYIAKHCVNSIHLPTNTPTKSTRYSFTLFLFNISVWCSCLSDRVFAFVSFIALIHLIDVRLH